MSEHCCQDEIELLSENLKQLNSNEKTLKKKYHQLLIGNLQKDIIIQNLKRKLESQKFSTFFEEITANCLNELRKVGNTRKEDSKFIRLALIDLYGKKELKTKTLSGRSKSGNKTDQIAPEKINILKRLFEERLSYIDGVDDLRKKSLEKLIRNGIDNANKHK